MCSTRQSTFTPPFSSALPFEAGASYANLAFIINAGSLNIDIKLRNFVDDRSYHARIKPFPLTREGFTSTGFSFVILKSLFS
ncbi:MAG: hypothetical protein CVT63_01180 [Candidatus Anoxymicrobium japonicum]|uniref:Uncharacterized protein n=1 Tax=Candidatus Anoxymicrobium japonicum TaxID=2013648 RepID=A0A2N3G7Q5_9ACTN|nr:MAG: hypothetical protein CVT63_01180 [Candidatus Anoxymicrobium japonicum]